MYNEKLGDQILKVLNQCFPDTLSFAEVRNALPRLSQLPDQDFLSTIDALDKHGLVQGKFYRTGFSQILRGTTKLELTPSGRQRIEEIARLEELGDRLFNRTSVSLYDDIAKAGAQLVEEHTSKGLARSSVFLRAVIELVLKRFQRLNDAFAQSYITNRRTTGEIDRGWDRRLREKLEQVWGRELPRAREIAMHLCQSTGMAVNDFRPQLQEFETRAHEIKSSILNEIEIAALEGPLPQEQRLDQIAHREPMDFSFILDERIRNIVERDYRELQELDVHTATKSVLVLSGGLIEGLLLDALVSEGKWTLDEGSRKSLNEMIDAALAAGIIRQDRLSHVAREYRDLVHPGREVRERISFSDADATVARAAVDITIREVRAWYSTKKAE